MRTSKSKSPSSSVLSSLLALSVTACTAMGCGISVEAEVPEVEVTQRDVEFTGIPGGDLGDVSMVRSFSQQHGKLEIPDGFDSEVKALGVSMTGKIGVENLDFIHSLRVTMSDGVHTPVELLVYERPSGAKTSDVLTLASTNPANVLDQWKTDAATFFLEVAGALPPTAWTIDIKVRFAGKLNYRY